MKSIRYLKSCKGQIKIDHTTFSNTEIIRTIKLSENKNVYLQNFFNTAKYLGYATITHGGQKMHYVGKQLRTLIRFTSKESVLPDIRGEHSFCQINSESDEVYKLEHFPAYYLDNIFSHSNSFSSECRGKYLILPDLGEAGAFDPHIEEEWNKLAPNYDNIKSIHHLVKEILYTLPFVLLIKDSDKYKSVFNFVGDVETINEIKECIYNFYLEHFFFGEKDLFDKNDVIINVFSDYKYKYIVFRFTMKNPAIHNSYMSFTNYYRSIPIDALVQNKISYFILVPKSFAIEHSLSCIDDRRSVGLDYQTDLDRIVYNKEKNTLGNVLGMMDIEVMNEFYTANHFHSYCSQFFLIKSNDIYYQISIKSITYKILQLVDQKIRQGQTKSLRPQWITFYDDYIKRLQYLQKNYHRQKYLSEAEDRIVLYAKMPAILEVYVQPVPHPNRSIRIYVNETDDDYQAVVKRYKKIEIMPDMSLLIHLMWRAMLRQSVKKENLKEYTKKLLLGEKIDDLDPDIHEITTAIIKNPVLMFYLMGNAIYDEQYVITGKMAHNNILHLLVYANLIHRGLIEYDPEEISKLEVKLQNNAIDYQPTYQPIIKSKETMISDIYDFLIENVIIHIVWYTPDFRITNKVKFIQLIGRLNIEYESIVNGGANWIKDIDTYSRYFGTKYNKYEYRELFLQSTNFRETYTNDQFLYTVRDLTEENVKPIQTIINTYQTFFNKKQLQIGIHYPTTTTFSILHMHLYSPMHGRVLEIFRNYTNTLETRALFWYRGLDEFISSHDTKRIRFMINMDRPDESIVNIATEYGRFELMKKIILENKYDEYRRYLL